MKIKLNVTYDDLDPNGISENPGQCLINYIDKVTEAIHSIYPDAQIEHQEQSDTYSAQVDDDPTGEISLEIQYITEDVYTAGGFWI
ncbi:hypothetical protein N8Z76_00460 [Gammaproteobacteria bacterium]|nr:hypothetical protein [Gammaproteobacteria bacterium]